MTEDTLQKIYSNCTLCPRRCGSDRTVGTGYCGTGDHIMIARAALHMWEEPVLTGKGGAGTVFFSGCNMKCVYCQNYEISSGRKGITSDKAVGKAVSGLEPKSAISAPGNYSDKFSMRNNDSSDYIKRYDMGNGTSANTTNKTSSKKGNDPDVESGESGGKLLGNNITISGLADIFLRLQDEGAENIDLVTPTHFTPSVIAALDIVRHRLRIPIVYNCGGYESTDTIDMLNGYVDIYMPDIKYFSDELAIKYSSAPHYFDTAISALGLMVSQTGTPVYDDNGVLKKGTIVRHMVLPGHRADSIAVLNGLYRQPYKDKLIISLLSQYVPMFKACGDAAYKSINRRVTSFEYNSVVKEALRLGFNGFMQEKSSANPSYTPDFDCGLPCSRDNGSSP